MQKYFNQSRTDSSNWPWKSKIQKIQDKLHYEMVLFIEEYSLSLEYIKGENKIVADVVSHLEIKNVPMDEKHFTDKLQC